MSNILAALAAAKQDDGSGPVGFLIAAGVILVVVSAANPFGTTPATRVVSMLLGAGLVAGGFIALAP